MSSLQTAARKLKPLWLSAWPLLALAGLGSLAATRWLAGGYARAVVAAPILLIIPGSLTLGAVFGPHHRPRGVTFICYSALLSVIWLDLASLALYPLNVLITADSLYWSLLVICAVLAVVAQTRLGSWPLMANRQATRSIASLSPGLPDYQTPAAAKAAVLYAIVAVLAGLVLLAGGVYVQEQLPRPASAGYTWMAWEYPQGKADFMIGSAGSKLPFTIVHRQPGTTTFRLSAAWQGRPSPSLAKPLTLRLRPNQSFHAALFIPPLPKGCTYRVVITLTATRQIDPLTKKPQVWSINAGVHGPGQQRKMCTL